MDGKKCSGCGAQLSESDIAGICSHCLFDQPFTGLWDPREPPSAEQVAERLPRFEIEKLLGKGAIGAVYGAVDKRLGRIVAIKVMFENPDTPEYSERFDREASVMAALHHPNIVTIHEYDKVDDLHYLVMERMEAGSLGDEIARTKKLSAQRAITVVGQVCDALDYVHSLKVVHRDVKPGNILLDAKGNAKLSDFGLVKGLTLEEFSRVALTRTDMAVGTPAYMAPEQIQWPATADYRADIYAAGAVLYEMVTGEMPTGRLKAPSAFPGVPKFIDPVVDRSMHKDRKNRYEGAGELKQDLIHRQGAKRRWLIGIGTAVTMALIAVAGVQAFEALRDSGGQGSVSQRPVPQDAIDGLRLGNFAEEIDLKNWNMLADYDFEQGKIDSAGAQDLLITEGDVIIENGMLRLSGLDQFAASNLKRSTTGSPKGLAVNFRFMPEAYLGLDQQDVILFEFSLHWKQGVFLKSSKWGDPLPTFLIDQRQPMAPPGVIEPHLAVGSWHDVWIVLSDGYRLWIDGVPVRRTRASAGLANWERWHGSQGVTIQVQGFRGLVDHIRVWEQKPG